MSVLGFVNVKPGHWGCNDTVLRLRVISKQGGTGV